MCHYLLAKHFTKRFQDLILFNHIFSVNISLLWEARRDVTTFLYDSKCDNKVVKFDNKKDNKANVSSNKL